MRTPFRAEEAVMAMQVCFVTEDIEATVKWFAELLDLPMPPIVGSTDPEVAQTQYLGQRVDVEFRQALMKWRGTQLEFVQPGPGPSVWRDWLNEHGPGIHHVGFAVSDFDAARRSLVDLGLPIVQEGAFHKGRYAYARPQKPIGGFVEILDVDADEVRAYGMD
ncbi:VOC family protein [Pseudarthrobacter phenanthrenivorans]|uniref:VOC family protein n=1 Tax=Pseudarthrobacter phenanthrenivorans TaxID=361575 RepID=UPI00344F2506